MSQRQLKLKYERGVLIRRASCSEDDLDFCCPNYHYGGNTGCDLCYSGPWGQTYIADSENSNMEKEWLDADGDYSIELHKQWLNERKPVRNYGFIDEYVRSYLISSLPDGETHSVLTVKVSNGLKNTFEKILENQELLRFPSSFEYVLETEMGKETGETCSFDIDTVTIYQQFLLWFELKEDDKETSKSKGEVIEELTGLLKDVKIDKRVRIMSLFHSVFNQLPENNVGGETKTTNDTVISSMTNISPPILLRQTSNCKYDDIVIGEAIGAPIPVANVNVIVESPTVKVLVENLIADLKRDDSDVSKSLEGHTCFNLPDVMKGLGENFKRQTPLRELYLAYLPFYYGWNFERLSTSAETKKHIKDELKKIGINQTQRVKWYVSIYEAELPRNILKIYDEDEDAEECEFNFSIELYLQFKTGDKFKEPKPFPVGTSW